MRMNRRNVLAGIGALTAGGGAVFGSGAFSSVEADRTVNVNVAGDSEALVALNVDSDLGTSTNGEVSIDLSSPENASGLNQNALTTFNAALAITNQGADPVDLTVPSAVSSESSGVTVIQGGQPANNSNEISIDFILNDGYTIADGDFGSPATDNTTGVSSETAVSAQSTAVYDLEIDLRGSTLNDSENFNIDMTILAESN